MPKTATQKQSIYGVHPGGASTMKWVAELKQKTGRTLDEWIKLIKKEGPLTEQARSTLLVSYSILAKSREDLEIMRGERAAR